MRHPRRWYALLFIVAVGRVACGQSDAVNWIVEGEPAYAQADAERWRDAMRPHVERAAGRAFDTAPAVRVVDRAELFRAIETELLAVLREHARTDMAERVRVEMEVGLTALGLAPVVVGMYSHEEHAVLLPAGNIRPIMSRAGAASEQMEPMMRLIVAHEMAHALLAQHVDRAAQLAQLRVATQARAFAAIDEGFAMLVQERVARATGADAAQARLLELLSLTWTDAPQARAGQQRYAEQYAAGHAFFRFHHEQGGLDRVWAIVEDPPPVYGQIAEPARYGEPVAMRVDPARLYDGFDDIFGGREWRDVAMTLEPDQLERNFRPLGPEVAADVVGSVHRVHALVMTDPASRVQSVRSVTLYELVAPERGEALLGHLRALEARQVEMLGRLEKRSGGRMKMTSESVDAIDGVEADGAFLTTARLAEAANPARAAAEMVIAAAWRDDRVVQVVSAMDPVDRAHVVEAMTTVLDRFERGAARVPVDPDAGAGPLADAMDAGLAAAGGADWSNECQTLGKADLLRMVGDDVGAAVAVEMGFVDARTCFYEDGAGAERRAAMLMVAEMATVQTADTVTAVLVARMTEHLRALIGGLPASGVDLDDPTTRPFGTGTISAQTAVVRVPNAPAGRIGLYATRRGRHVVTLADVQAGFDDATVDRILTAVLDALPGASPEAPEDR